MRLISNYIILFVTTFLFLSLQSCSTEVSCGNNKDAFIGNFYGFVEEVKSRQQKGDVSDNEWTAYDVQFNKLTQDCYKKFEQELTTTDHMGIAAGTGFYLYAKYGASVVMKLMQQDAIVREILSDVDPMLLVKIATEVLNNPEELRNIIGDLEKRYN